MVVIMQELRFLESLLSIPMALQTGVVFALGFLFLITLTMTKNMGFKKQVLQSKRLKAEIVKYILNNLDAANYLSLKIIKDNEIVGVYNTETLILGLRAVNKLERIDNRLNILGDHQIKTHLSNYIQNLKQLLTKTYHMENNLYEYKKRSAQILLSYDREFIKLSSEDDIQKALEVKKSFKTEIDNHKRMVRELENTYEEQRRVVHQELLNLNITNDSLQVLLDNYKRKHVDTKKFYASKLVYA